MNTQIEELTPRCYTDEKSIYSYHQKTYLVAKPINLVWKKYITLSPEVVWTGKMISFKELYDRSKNKKVQPGDLYSDPMGKGQLILLNLKILNGLINVTVGHEVMEINEIQRVIKTSYLSNSKSEGSQFIRFKELQNGTTEVSHETFYKSDSWFRDRYIYPFFHTRALNEFHGNVIKQILLS